MKSCKTKTIAACKAKAFATVFPLVILSVALSMAVLPAGCATYETEGACDSDSDCDWTFRCIDGTCSDACEHDWECRCPPGYYDCSSPAHCVEGHCKCDFSWGDGGCGPEYG